MRTTSLLSVALLATAVAACVGESAVPAAHSDGGAAGHVATGAGVGAGGALTAIPSAGTTSAGVGSGGLSASGSAGTGAQVGGSNDAGATSDDPLHPTPGPFDGTGDLRDGNLRFVGRWDRSDASAARSYWGGAYVRIDFEGTQLKVDVDGGATFMLDGTLLTPPASNGTVRDLAPQIASGGHHQLRVIAANQNLELTLRGLTLGAETKTVAAPAPPLVEFAGDSITTGGGPDFSSLVPYSWLIGEQLGCDHTQISFSGAALTSGYGFTTDKSGMDVEYFRTKNFNHPAADNSAWDFTRYQADLVVINLGTNDANEPADTFQASYQTFIAALRGKYPAAQLVALRPFGGAFSAAISAAVTATVAAGDARVHFIDTEGWLQNPSDFVDGTHPTPDGHLKVVAKLVPLLRPYLPPAK